ncbi:hypothetical protein PAPHI01_2004 [Pancytospora philotis]|nr:hypothetical protein PAPHI01_2004 [Pancytospora philotis]
MKIDHVLVVFLMLFLAFLGVGKSAIIPAKEGERASSLAGSGEQPAEPILELALTETEIEDKFDKYLYQCYYRDQPVRSKRERAKGSRPRLYGVCDKDAITRDIIPKKGRRHHHYGGRPRHSDKEAGTPAPADVESNYDETRDGIYSVLTKVRYAPSRKYTKAGSAFAELVHPTFSATELERVIRDEADLISVLHHKLVEHELVYYSDEDPIQDLTIFGHFYLKSKSFKHFLSTWEKNDGNARYHITQADVDRIRDEVQGGMRFRWLSSTDKELFGKLVFVRNVLETYATIREVMEPLGLEAGDHRTAEDFLQAMHGYLMAVHESNGKLAVATSVRLSVFASQLLSFAYAGCQPSKVTTTVDGKEVALDDIVDEKAHHYIEGMIVLFKAWFKSYKDYLDPAVLSAETSALYSYDKPSDNYDNGCQELAQD